MRHIHLGLIPDGNRRWAREHGLAPTEGHRHGAVVMENCLKWCLENEIEEVSVYSLSIENLIKRPQDELREIFRVLAHYFNKLSTDDLVHKYEIKVRVLGRIYKLPDFVVKAANNVMRSTRPYQRHVLNLLVAYGAQDELLRCAQALSRSRIGRVTRKILERSLWVSRPVDLIIRTGGDHRLSNFLLYQSAYAEIFFVDKYWPDFTRDDFEACLEAFERSQRRMGG